MRPSPLCTELSAPSGDKNKICLRNPFASRVGRSLSPLLLRIAVSSASSCRVARLNRAFAASSCVSKLSLNVGRTRLSSAAAAAALLGGGSLANKTSAARANDSSRVHRACVFCSSKRDKDASAVVARIDPVFVETSMTSQASRAAPRSTGVSVVLVTKLIVADSESSALVVVWNTFFP